MSRKVLGKGLEALIPQSVTVPIPTAAMTDVTPEVALDRIDTNPRLELMADPTYLNLCFRYVPIREANPGQVDELNRRIRDRLAESGSALVNYAYIDDRVTIRLVLPNPALTIDILESLFDDLIEVAQAIETTWLGSVEADDGSVETQSCTA